MAFELKQNLRQTQNLLLSPQIQQAIKILTLGRMELQEFVAEELKENPCLEEADDHVSDPHVHTESDRNAILSQHELQSQGMKEANAAPDSEVNTNLADLGEALMTAGDPSSGTGSQSAHSHDSGEMDLPLYDKINSKGKTLHEDLEQQLTLMHLTEEEFHTALILLQYIDDDGYLDSEIDEIAYENNLNSDDLLHALAALQKCEPTGVGARNTQECLLLQVRAKSQVPKLVETIILHFWKELQKVEIKKISRSLKLDEDTVKSAMLFIRTELDPRPARQYGSDENHVVEPDVFIFQRAGAWVVSLNEDGLPRLKVGKQYENLVKNISKEHRSAEYSELKSFVNTRMKSAKWLVRALAERNKTILRVAEVIAEKQADFLEKGVEHLKPMTLKTIADELELHESTISRSTTNKYVQTPRGLFELKYFFNSAMSGKNGEQLANETIKVWVGEYIRGEDPKKPLSDQEISERISREKDVKVARRTVAKYRESLGIASSSKRVKKL